MLILLQLLPMLLLGHQLVMALGDKKLGDSYMGAKYDGTDYAANDPTILYRGHKDLLVYKLPGPSDPRVVISRKDKGAPSASDTLRATLYQLNNLLDDPGEERQRVAFIEQDSTHIFYLQGSRYPEGLYRIRIEPNTNGIDYTVEIQDIQYYAQESWEPRYNFYVHGQDNSPPIDQYFFIPGDAGTVKVRLETEKGIEKTRLKIFRITPTVDSTVLTIAVKGKVRGQPDPDTAYFASGTFRAAAGDSRRPSGQIYKFSLRDPGEDGERGEGNIWVRFSRNVPPYFADDWHRLMVPIVHREFDPVLYYSQTQTYRDYLCLDRGSSGIGASDTLKLRVDTQSQTTTTGYKDSVSYTSPDTRTKLSSMVAQLKNGNTVVASSTDKVDTIYTVQPPTWDTWTNPLYVMYDDKNGADATEITGNSHYKTIQCSDTTAFRKYFSPTVQAMGVLYAGNMELVFNATPDHANIRFWKLWDEVDSGPSPGTSDLLSGPLRTLKSVYSDYYTKKNKPTSKMLALNHSHAFAMEEYAEGCDIVMTDPYVKEDATSTAKRIAEWAGAAKATVTGNNADKRIIVLLWAWPPPSVDFIIKPKSLYGTEWNLLVNDPEIDGIATYKWGKNNFYPSKLTEFPDGNDLWQDIRLDWDEFRP